MGFFWNSKKDTAAPFISAPSPVDISKYPVDEFKMTISDVFPMSDGYKMVSGTVDAGAIKVDDIVLIAGQIAQVTQLENFSRRTPPERSQVPLEATVLSQLERLFMSDLDMATRQLEDVLRSSANVTADATVGESVALRVSTPFDTNTLKGSVVYKLTPNPPQTGTGPATSPDA